mmetsp:Transcript_15762/g.37267  ORF Transcript_15762/g.37267 Transcript_15762/m.37267 type:complete len:202 (-) Transcript_15762:107-712(-)
MPLPLGNLPLEKLLSSIPTATLGTAALVGGGFLIGGAVLRIAGQVVGIAYPTFASFKAIEESKGPDQTKQWLTYWTCFGCFTLVEAFADRLIFWLPYYYAAKLAFLVFLQHPKTNGASILYEHFVRPLFLQHQGTIEDKARAAYSHMTKKADEVMKEAVADLTKNGVHLSAAANEVLRAKITEALAAQSAQASIEHPTSIA